MSDFRTQEASCPACGETVRVEVLDGVRAEDHPEVREALLAGRLGAATCSCGAETRVWVPCVYTDFEHGTYVALAGPVPDWRALVPTHAKVFDEALTLGPPFARSIGARLKHRLVLDPLALREKVLLFEANLDDRVVEALKGAWLKKQGRGPADELLRVSAVLEGGHLLLARWQPGAVRGEGPWVMERPTLLGHVTLTADRYQKRWMRRDATSLWPALAHPWMVDLYVASSGVST